MNDVERVDTVVPALPDKIGVAVGVGDYVLVAHNGPYLNFGRVWRVQTSPRVTLEIQEAYQPENDASRPFQARTQSICSSHRVIRIDGRLVPVSIRDIINLQPVHPGHGS